MEEVNLKYCRCVTDAWTRAHVQTHSNLGPQHVHTKRTRCRKRSRRRPRNNTHLLFLYCCGKAQGLRSLSSPLFGVLRLGRERTARNREVRIFCRLFAPPLRFLPWCCDSIPCCAPFFVISGKKSGGPPRCSPPPSCPASDGSCPFFSLISGGLICAIQSLFSLLVLWWRRCARCECGACSLDL